MMSAGRGYLEPRPTGAAGLGIHECPQLGWEYFCVFSSLVTARLMLQLSILVC